MPIYAVNFGKLYEVNSADQLLGMLDLERIDAILTNSYSWTKFEYKTKDVNVIPFRDLSVFVWLTNANHGWSEDIAKAINSYRSNGGNFLED